MFNVPVVRTVLPTLIFDHCKKIPLYFEVSCPYNSAVLNGLTWGGCPKQVLSCGCGVEYIHTEVCHNLGSTRNVATDLGCGLELVCNEAELSRGR